MTDKALEAALEAWFANTVKGWSEAMQAAISAYLSALQGEAEVVAYEYELATRVLGGVTGNLAYASFEKRVTDYAPQVPEGSVRNLHPLVTLASLQAMQARAEAAERERDEAREYGGQARIREQRAEDARITEHDRAEAAEARVKELEAKLSEAADEIESWGAYASEYFQEKHDLPGVVREFREFTLKGGSNG